MKVVLALCTFSSSEGKGEAGLMLSLPSEQSFHFYVCLVNQNLDLKITPVYVSFGSRATGSEYAIIESLMINTQLIPLSNAVCEIFGSFKCHL